MRLWLSLFLLLTIGILFIFWPRQDAQRKQEDVPKAVETPLTEDIAMPKAKETEKFSLLFPLNCTLGESCWTARYVFRGGEKQDFACKSRTQIGHKGTDFVIADMDTMHEGVSVFAAAQGKVKGVRNNEPDISVHKRSAAETEGKECGNGVVLEHKNGWTTQYCHMKQGSVLVKSGETIEAGSKIGEVGLSGETEYPHLHFSLRKEGKRMDPFDGAPAETLCNSLAVTEGLWTPKINYSPMDLVSVKLTAIPPKRETVWQKAPEKIDVNAPSLVLTGVVFGMQAGDRWQFKIVQPDGRLFFVNEKSFPNDKQFHYQFGGKKRPKEGFKKGLWVGEIIVERVLADGNTLFFKKDTSVVIE